MSDRDKDNAWHARQDRSFKLRIKYVDTGEVFLLENISYDMKISELKNLAEYVCGIPINMQKISYLDSGDLTDHSDVRSYDIVPMGMLRMEVWSIWQGLVEAAAKDDTERLLQLGVTEEIKYTTATTEYLGPEKTKPWLNVRACVALYIAAHRGHKQMCQILIDKGANIDWTTPLGRTALHVAAAQGHGRVVDLLLENGADPTSVDVDDENPVAAACRFGKKDCERRLFLYSWQQRAKQMKHQDSPKLMAHQCHDSSNPVWLKGDQAQIYFQHIVPSSISCTSKEAIHRTRPPSSVSSSVLDSDSEVDECVISVTSNKLSGKNMLSFSQLSPTPKEIRVKKRAAKQAKQYGRLRTKYPGSYDNWLRLKKSEEQVKVDRSKDQMAAFKRVEEDRVRQQDFHDKSYEQWLALKAMRKDGHLLLGSAPAGPFKPPTTISKKMTGYSNIDITEKQDIIRTVTRRKEEEMYRRGVLPYDKWMSQKDSDILEQIRAGATPLESIIDRITNM